MKSQGAFRLCLSHPPQKAEKYQNSPKIFRPTLFQQTSCKTTAKPAKICWKHRIRCSAKLSLVKREREGESIIRKQQLFPFSSLPHFVEELCTAVHCFVHLCSALLGGECRWSSSCHKHHSCSLSFPSSCLLLTSLLLTTLLLLLLTAHFTLPLNCTEVKMPRTPTGALLSRLLQCTVRTAPRCTIIPLHCSLSTIK